MMRDHNNKEKFFASSLSSSLSSTTSSFGCDNIGDPSSSSSSSSFTCFDDNHISHHLEDDQRLRFVDGGKIEKDGMHWKEVEQRFDQIAFGASHENECVPSIDASHFGYCIGMRKTSQFASELLQALRKGRKSYNNNVITKRELNGYWHLLTSTSCDSTMKIFFDMFDKDMDGKIVKSDFKQMIMLSASTNKMGMKQEEADHFATLIMHEIDTQQKGYIEFNQFKELFKKALSSKEHPSSVEQKLTQMSAIDVSSTSNDDCIMYQNINHNDPKEHITMSLPEIMFRTHWRRAWVVTLWLVICITLFAWKFNQYKHRAAFQVMGYCLSTAKGAAETLKFNMALVLLPVCRNLVTWLRRSPRISSIVPFNDNINFHKEA